MRILLALLLLTSSCLGQSVFKHGAFRSGVMPQIGGDLVLDGAIMYLSSGTSYQYHNITIINGGSIVFVGDPFYLNWTCITCYNLITDISTIPFTAPLQTYVSDSPTVVNGTAPNGQHLTATYPASNLNGSGAIGGRGGNAGNSYAIGGAGYIWYGGNGADGYTTIGGGTGVGGGGGGSVAADGGYPSFAIDGGYSGDSAWGSGGGGGGGGYTAGPVYVLVMKKVSIVSGQSSEVDLVDSRGGSAGNGGYGCYMDFGGTTDLHNIYEGDGGDGGVGGNGGIVEIHYGSLGTGVSGLGALTSGGAGGMGGYSGNSNYNSVDNDFLGNDGNNGSGGNNGYYNIITP